MTYLDIRKQKHSSDLERFLKTPELADRLGFSERHVANLVKQKRIPVIKIGRAVRFDWPSVCRALKLYQVDEVSID
jgi:excisionase family DNA binding protein